MNSLDFLKANPDLQRILLDSEFLDIIPVGFSIATDISCKKIVHNPIAAKFLRIEPWEQFPYYASEPLPAKVYHDGKPIAAEDLPMQRAAWYGEVIDRFELEFVWEDGDSKFARWSASPLRDDSGNICGAIATIEDVTEVVHLARNGITEMKRIYAEMARLDRLNLVGQMAAGIGHEIRNPMTTVRGYLQLLGNKPEFKSRRSTFETMIEELDRANSIISEFLSLAKNAPTERQCQNINDILRHLYPLLEADTFTQNKQIVFEKEETPDILLNAKEICQLVLNLCRNGLEAMKERGTLAIRIYTEGEQVVLSVQDEGSGIPTEYLDKLGTPFFTTKENGTGLGLATCYDISNRHNARIDVESGSNGTTFFVRFPCLADNHDG
ncbi:MAG: ATP-binding protein [Desulfitobacteriaceae bacterium]